MKEVNLFELAENNDKSARELLEALAQLESAPKVYETYVPGQGSSLGAVLLTTSKEVHLALGRFTRDLLFRLCTIFDQETDNSDTVVINLAKKGNRPERILVTNTSLEIQWVYHLSPVNN